MCTTQGVIHDASGSEASEDIPHSTVEHTEGVRLSFEVASRAEGVQSSVEIALLARVTVVRLSVGVALQRER
jgi:hypothetical protein